MNDLLAKVKLTLRITESTFDSEIADLINACLSDLGVAGVSTDMLADVYTDPLIIMAVKTYCRAHFGEPDEYERLKASYDEQKAQLSMYSGYTVWTEAEQ